MGAKDGIEQRTGHCCADTIALAERVGTPGGPALRRLGRDSVHSTGQVKGIGSAYWRIVGSVEAIAEKAKAIDQDWMKGIGYARWLAKARCAQPPGTTRRRGRLSALEQRLPHRQFH